MSEPTFSIIEATGRICKKPGFGWKLATLDTVDSTNTYAKSHEAETEDPTIYVAKHQTAGKGRGGNTWVDDGNETSFLSTWTLELKKKGPDPKWTLGIGLYVYESLSEAFPSIRFSLKPPNDICIGDKKVAGILVEGSDSGDLAFLHVGLGINVFSYPTEFSQTATHLNAYLGPALTPESWSSFIEMLGSRLLHIERRAEAATKGWLNQISGRLINAYNRHPSATGNQYKAVEADGTLVREQGPISWRDI